MIDPCTEDPEAYLGYDALGDVFAVDDNIYGNETIRVFNLKRRRLKGLRYEKVYVTVQTFNAMNRAIDRGDEDAVADFRKLLEHFQRKDQQFAAVARYVEYDPAAFNIQIT